MDQKTVSANSTKTSENVLVDALHDLERMEANDQHPDLQKENFPIDELNMLREQLIRKNRILADLKRQLIGAQNSLTQLQCMTDPEVMATFRIHQDVTGKGISMFERAASAMVKVDSSAERMSYLIKQLQKSTLSIQF